MDTSQLTWNDIWDPLHRFSQHFPVKTERRNDFEPNADVRPTTQQLIARLEEDGWVIEPRRWSLVPFFYKGRLKPSARGAGDGFKLTTFNCRVETAATAATFRGPFKSRRCLVPASAWYEWTGPEGGKTKHRFARVDGAPLWFAGLYDRCTTEDEGEVQSFTILTGPSSGWLADYHSRAPVILDEADFPVWMDPTLDAADLMYALRPERFELREAA